jgi:AraC-like DNA-binding protein
VGGEADFVVDRQAYRLSAGGVLLTPPRVPHGAQHNPLDPLCTYTVHFVARLFGGLDMPAFYGLPVALRPAPGCMAQIAAAAGRIASELAAAEPGCTLAANGDGARLLALLWRETVAQSGGLLPGWPRAAEAARLAPVFQIIQARYAQRLTLQVLADAVHLHPAYFSTLFKRIVGVPPLQYLARYRLDRARELLLSTDQAVSEIATVTGYRDAFYLSRVFRRAEGVSPRAYRRSKKSPALP